MTQIVYSGAFDWYNLKKNATLTHKLTGTQEFWEHKRIYMPTNNSFLVNYGNVPIIHSFLTVANLSIPALLEVDDIFVDPSGKYVGTPLFKDYGPFTPFQLMK